MSESDFLITIAGILGPKRGEGLYMEGETRPWVVVCGEPYKFTTPEAAIAKARELAAME